MKQTIQQDIVFMLLRQFSQWIKNSPSLFNSDDSVLSQPPFSSCEPLDESNTYQGNPRLGFLYQHICHELFDSSDRYDILADEIQLNETGRTIGAIDFIIRDNKLERFQHWEVAIKFYLLFDGKWYGPNAKDRLDKKLDHMLGHQLAMSDHQQFKQHYPQWLPIDKKLLMQGRLYINPFLNEAIPNHCLGHAIDPSRISGYWCYQSQFNNINNSLYLLNKQQWAVGTYFRDIPYLNTLTGFAHCQDSDGNFWFIVPEEWPHN